MRTFGMLTVAATLGGISAISLLFGIGVLFPLTGLSGPPLPQPETIYFERGSGRSEHNDLLAGVDKEDDANNSQVEGIAIGETQRRTTKQQGQN